MSKWDNTKEIRKPQEFSTMLTSRQLVGGLKHSWLFWGDVCAGFTDLSYYWRDICTCTPGEFFGFDHIFNRICAKSYVA